MEHLRSRIRAWTAFFIAGLLVVCGLVPLWALLFGHIRGIPGWWRAIDAAFGVVGFIPMWLCHRWVGQIERHGR